MKGKQTLMVGLQLSTSTPTTGFCAPHKKVKTYTTQHWAKPALLLAQRQQVYVIRREESHRHRTSAEAPLSLDVCRICLLIHLLFFVTKLLQCLPYLLLNSIVALDEVLRIHNVVVLVEQYRRSMCIYILLLCVVRKVSKM